MNSANEQPTRDRTAIAFSIVTHACALWLLAKLIGGPAVGFGDASDGGTSVLPVTTINIEPRSPRVVLGAAIGRVRPGLRAAPPARVVAPQSAVSPSRAAAFEAPRSRTAAAAMRAGHGAGEARGAVAAATTASQPAFAETSPGRRFATTRARADASLPLSIALATPAPLDTHSASAEPAEPVPPAPTPTPPPSSSPSPAGSAPASPPSNFGGLFSQNYPPALTEPSRLNAIRSRLTSHTHIRVDVDETGRATDVHLIGAQPDPAVADALRTELLALHYVPADCNGLHCDGTLEIDY